MGVSRLVQWTRRLRLCLHSSVWGGAPLTSIVSEMKPTRVHCESRSAQIFLGVVLVSALLSTLSGCGTFSGMSSEERDQANRDLAKESNYWPAFKPERSLQDNHEVPAHAP